MTQPSRLTRAEVLDRLGITNTSLSRALGRTREHLNTGQPLQPGDIPLPDDDDHTWPADQIAEVVAYRRSPVGLRLFGTPKDGP